MNEREFCYWLQGLFEVGGAKSLDERQTQIVKDHLALVFKHEIDPAMGDKAHQDKLNNIHGTSMNDMVFRC